MLLRRIFQFWAIIASFLIVPLDCFAVDIIDLGASDAWCVSGNAGVVGLGRNNGQPAKIWTASNGIQNLGTLSNITQNVGGYTSYRVSADGSTVTGWYEGTDPGGNQFLWNASNGIQNIGSITGDYKFSASGLSSDGKSISGASVSGNIPVAAYWSNSNGLQYLPALDGGIRGGAFTLSTGGNFIAGYSFASDGFNHATRWTPNGGILDIGVPTSRTASFAYGISDDGNTIVGYSSGNGSSLSFVWTPSTGIYELNPLFGETNNALYAISPDGKVAVGGVQGNGEWAMIWNSESNQLIDLRDLLIRNNVPGIENWTSLKLARNVSGNATSGYNIVGWGYNKNNVVSAFLIRGLTTVPEPSTWILMIFSGAILAIKCRKY